MAGYLGGHYIGPDEPPFEARRKRAWLPVRSSQSGERIWLRHYWLVDSYHMLLPPNGNTNGAHWVGSEYTLTEHEFLLYSLRFSTS